MKLPDAAALDAALTATWPAARIWTEGEFTCRDGARGGKRVSAATLNDASEIPEAHVREIPRLVRVREHEAALDNLLASLGYAIVDPTVYYAAPARALINPRHRPLDAVTSEIRLGIQAEIWAEGGIGPSRLAVMDRVRTPKAWLLARLDDRAVGVGFVAASGNVAMVHALETRPAFRRRGAAGAMLNRAARWALGVGAQHVALAVTAGNTPANAAYAALGMTVAGRYHYRSKAEGRSP